MSNFSMPPMDPNAYAAHYAELNGISFEEAKDTLRNRHGNPTPPGGNFMQEGFKKLYHPPAPSANGQTQQQLPPPPQQPPAPPTNEQMQQQLPPAPPVMQDEYRQPLPPQSQGNFSGFVFAQPQPPAYTSDMDVPLNATDVVDRNQGRERELITKYGIPEYVVAQGDDAIRKYAQENNINLPPKGQY